VRGLVIGEAETRATALLADHRRTQLPGVMWPGPVTGTVTASQVSQGAAWLAPDINALPFVGRSYLARDPHPEKGRTQASMVGARGCPYNCSFCGAAVSANPDITMRVRDPENILAEMHQLRGTGVTGFRFVDDLFLGARRVISQMMTAFTAAGTGDWARWDATGRINVLNRLDDADLAGLAAAGLREVALGIESGSQWDITDPLPGGFTASAFEYRPYPGTPDWDRLIATGRHTPAELLNYTAVDLTSNGTDEAMLERDEFNFSVNLPLAEAPISRIRASLITIAREQHARFPGTAA
jgi:anaerobic magnesium-protoporphyrin IX monomethyl ester cyclase